MFHSNEDAHDEQRNRLAYARQDWYMHALALHNVKEFSRQLIAEPAAQKTAEEQQTENDENFALFDKWLSQKADAPPDWVVQAYQTQNGLAPRKRRRDEVQADEPAV